MSITAPQADPLCAAVTDALAGELQRDLARGETVEGLRQIVLTERVLQE